jgi:hypothetical protein
VVKKVFPTAISNLNNFAIANEPVMAPPNLIPHTCRSCGKPLRGRADKKFCDTGCKNTYNNNLQSQERAEINHIDLILKHNRRILKAYLGDERCRRITRAELMQKGLRFDFYTQHYTTRRLDEYFFCYDYGYLSIGEGRCLIVRSRLAAAD